MAPAPGARAPADASSSSRKDTTSSAPDVIRDQARRPEGARSAHPFPSCTSHSRTKSTPAVGEPGASLDFPPAGHPPRRRVRAASSATLGAAPGSRPRLPSMLASVLTQNRAPARPSESTNNPDLIGSFTPTSCPRPRLQRLLSLSGTSSSHPAPLPHPSAPHAASFGTERRRAHLHSSQPRSRHQSVPVPPLPVDPPASPNLPSICRTPSSYSGSDYFSTAPSSAGPTTPVPSAAALPEGRKPESLHPVLASLEQSSMFRVQTACATCGKYGSNFPCCPKCGEKWCSRVCRLRKGNGKRHICAKGAI